MRASLIFLFVILMGDQSQCQSGDYEIEYEHEPGPDILGLIKQTALGKEISDKISESVDAINQYAQAVGSKAQSMFDNLGRQAEREAMFAKQDIQNNAIAAVQNVHGRLTQSAGDMRLKTESLIEAVAHSLQTHLVVFWESLTKGNETHPLFQ